MERERMTKESREELLERILEETARKPYKPGSASRSTPPKPAANNIGKKETVERTQVFSGADAAALFEEEKTAPVQRRTQTHRNSEAPHNYRRERPVQSDAEREEQERIAAAEKIREIQREKAAAAKAAIMKKTEIENSRIAQEEAAARQFEPVSHKWDGNDERVNIITPDEDYDGYDDYYDESLDDIPDFSSAEDSGQPVCAVMNIFQYAVCILFAVFLIFGYILNFAGVSGESMMPTLSDGDTVLALCAAYTPEKGDVVVIDSKTAALLDENGNVTEKTGLDCKIAKRIIAVGGDTVDIDFENGTVTVNGDVLEENYISEPTTRDEGAFEYPLTIPEGYVFVLGDNRNISKDSRHPDVGLVPEDEIIGKAVLRVYPFGSFGTIG
ncbi:MAG: signal peptidase I [Porcipelethomonas sp.]